LLILATDDVLAWASKLSSSSHTEVVLCCLPPCPWRPDEASLRTDGDVSSDGAEQLEPSEDLPPLPWRRRKERHGSGELGDAGAIIG